MDSDSDNFFDAEDDFDAADYGGAEAASTILRKRAPSGASSRAMDQTTKANTLGDKPPSDQEMPQDPFRLHRAAWSGQVELVKRLAAGMSPEELQAHDSQGNTALHVAAMRRHREVVEALLAAGAPAACRNARGWGALEEAVEVGDADLATLVAQADMDQMRLTMRSKRSALLSLLRSDLPDCRMALQWELGSTMPGLGTVVRNLAPHDTYTVWKKGGRVRVDGTLMGVGDEDSASMLSLKRGHFSLLYDASAEKARALFINHTDKTYVDLKAARKKATADGGFESVVATEVEALMACEVLQRKKMCSVDFHFRPVSGWLTKEVREKVEGWSCKLYEASGRLIKVSQYKMPYGLGADWSYDDYLAATFEPDPIMETPVNLSMDRDSNPAKAAAKLAVAAKHQRIATEQAAARNEEAAARARAAAARAAAGGMRALAPPLDSDSEGPEQQPPQQPGEEKKGGASEERRVGASSNSVSKKRDGGSGNGGGSHELATGEGVNKSGKRRGGKGARVDATAEAGREGEEGCGRESDDGGSGVRRKGEEEEEEEGASALDVDLTALAAQVAAQAAAAEAEAEGKEGEGEEGEEEYGAEEEKDELFKGRGWGGVASSSSTSLVSSSAAVASAAGGGTADSSVRGRKGASAAAAGGPSAANSPGNGNLAQGGGGTSAGGPCPGGPTASSCPSSSGAGTKGSNGKSWRGLTGWGFGGKKTSAQAGSGKESAGGAAANGSAGASGSGSGANGGGANSGAKGGDSAARERRLQVAKRSRKIGGKCWMAESFPLSLKQLLPLLEVVGTANKAFARVARFMNKYGDLAMFPVKVQVPIIFTIYMLLIIKQFRLLGVQGGEPAPDDSFFEVPVGYTEGKLAESSPGKCGPKSRGPELPSCSKEAKAGGEAAAPGQQGDNGASETQLAMANLSVGGSGEDGRAGEEEA